jgi:hypothetical protein
VRLALGASQIVPVQLVEDLLELKALTERAVAQVVGPAEFGDIPEGASATP